MEDLKNYHQCVRLGFTFYFTFRRYCPGCRNDVSEVVLAGEKLKESKKKAKMASASSSSQRDWGKVSANTIWILNLSAFFFFSLIMGMTITHHKWFALSPILGYGLCRSNQTVHHCSIQSLRPNPWHSCRFPMEVQSPGLFCLFSFPSSLHGLSSFVMTYSCTLE